MDLKVVACLSFLLLLFSCDKRNTISNIQKVILPKKIAPANHQAEKFKHKRGKKTIITILGAKCSSCIHEMKIWKQYFEKGKIDRERQGEKTRITDTQRQLTDNTRSQ